MPEVNKKNIRMPGGTVSQDVKAEIREPKKRSGGSRRTPNLIGSGAGFAATEAYKLLRTNLQYSFADDEGCHVIGVTSSLRGEGKSTTSVNTAYTLAEAGSRVLLLDCDLRIPSIAEKLHLKWPPRRIGYPVETRRSGECDPAP